jgi:alginate O-acetyltransferase complex protein AlgJ
MKPALWQTKNRGKLIATKSWEQWLKTRGVRMYFLMLCPNKDTIYPEFSPDWMQAAENSPTNALLAKVSQDLYVDPRGALRAAKHEFSAPLYYKTDTHWNSLGAWVAFRSLTTKIALLEPGLRWLSSPNIHVFKVAERHGGDLANILKIKEKIRDSEVAVKITSERRIETKQYDFETGQLMTSGANPLVAEPRHPILVKSQHALNQKKVMWLRDSYGTAMSPYMAATFTETLQVDYRKTDPDLFARLVDTFKPDYVFIAVAERDARTQWFQAFHHHAD